MTKYEATDSRGKLHKRGTQNRTYTHVVVAYYDADYEPKVSWAGSPALAEARANTYRNYTSYSDPTKKIFGHVEIVEAREV